MIFAIFLKMVFPKMAIYVKILKNHIYVDFVKIQEFILVIIFVIFPQKWQFLNFLGIQPINGLFGSVTVMLMTSLCWWLYDGDWFQILVAECWRFFRYVGDFLNVLNRSPNLSHICHTFGLQHPSPTSMSPFGSDWLTWKPIWEIFLSKQILEVILLVENIWNQMKLELHLLWWLMIKVSILEQLLFVIETHFNKKEFLRRIYQVKYIMRKWNQCRKESDPTYNDSEIELWISRSMQNRMKTTSLKFRVVLSLIRLSPTLI